MFNTIKKSYSKAGAVIIAGIIMGGSSQAHAGTGGTSGNNFGSIAENITNSIAELPGLLSALSYLFGILLGVLGVMKIKDHVENPTQTPLKDGAIRLASGGALFALPILFEAMTETIGNGDQAVVADLNRVNFAVTQ